MVLPSRSPIHALVLRSPTIRKNSHRCSKRAFRRIEFQLAPGDEPLYCGSSLHALSRRVLPLAKWLGKIELTAGRALRR